MHSNLNFEKRLICSAALRTRREILAEGHGATHGLCVKATRKLIALVQRETGLVLKQVSGVFRLDTKNLSDEEAHTWAEWRGLPVDVTADQFQDEVFERIPVVVIGGRHIHRYCGWDHRPVYSGKAKGNSQ